ncbi:protein of unknown function DUF29 [Gloeothece citriformis PCC 7424]|uniref:DUF29 domain-containing protein n=1 Tax=Gloeothece citriformis (strain PCC 7424) TaxID=65393 RepID=B7KJK5_GLOC7|nr:DUF29 domain-containing protein [Gloeothece citriformis]ACK73682.1 protein of unknown function DUF29 [Gloeothece citriformis PCC 7424]
MSKKNLKAFQSNLTVILWHLLKYKYQPGKRSKSWRTTLLIHRKRLATAFLDTPSLKPLFTEVFDKCYQKARKEASIETGLSIETFPLVSPFTPEEVLDLEYLPE